jgi:WD repeat-containing protein 68
MLACFGMDESKVLILDMRSPGQPVAELVGHGAPVSGIAWGSGGNGSSISGGGWIASCGMSHSFFFAPEADNQGTTVNY